MLANKGHWFLFTVDTVLQCPASVDQNSHWGEAHHFLLSSDYRPSVDRPSTNYWPIHRSSIDQLSAKCRQSVGEVSVNEKLYRPRHIWNDYRPCLVRVSTHYRPTIDRYIDRLSTECRPSIDRLSTECRPTIDRVSTDYGPSVDRYIDRYIDRYLGRHYPQ